MTATLRERLPATSPPSQARTPVYPGTYARYPLDVQGRSVDRAAWATLVQQLMDAETRGKITPFARKVGVNPRTVSRWLSQDTDASEESVRAVADALGRPALDMLIAVGYYTAGDLTTAPAAADDHDEAMRIIDAADLPPSVKARMRDRLQARRAQLAEHEADEVRGWLDLAKGT